MNLFQLREKFNSMNGEQTIAYLRKLYATALKPRVVDCTKALIFVIGNLDEVYHMASDFSTEISADDFHE